MRRILHFLLLCCAVLLPGRAAEITVLQWNVWQEGTVVEGGYEAIVSEIARLRPDFVTLSEVRNYGGADFIARLCRSLARRGLTYHGVRTDDSGILSRHALRGTATVFPLRDDHGSVYRIRAEAYGRTFSVYTAHLDYLDDAYYNVRGYDGSTWKPCPVPATAREALERNARSCRDEAVAALLRSADDDEREGCVSIVGGDFNEPSYLDWCDATRHLFDHHGLAVPWPQTLRLAEAGFTDCWRALYPNPVTHPGFTFPADNPDVPVERLTWTPAADERERIDYVFFRGEGMSVAECRIFGPRGTIARSRRCPAEWDEPFVLPLGLWPTDHKGLLVRLRVD